MCSRLEKSKQGNLKMVNATMQVWMMELSQYNDLGADIRGFPSLWPHILISLPWTRISWQEPYQKDPSDLFQ